eukprot:TRINITY_DN7853_c0_g1_i3.p1 TRINITY_DN7853_c0_g1~~TRINITY_DN7853_c0_g1_i3.p1  ORF type:complete len:528 (-),score=100.39 TRINITY_DN7853_c0_g1_i3:260-1843(-)
MLCSQATFILFNVLVAIAFKIQSDPQRPQYHVMPPSDWMNDPNGPVYYKGYYHLFFQYNPSAPTWGTMHWGHAVSKDFAHWQHLPIALYPDQPYDKEGVWTGSITTQKDGTPIIIYTAQSNVEKQAVALPKNVSDPFLIDWIKPSYNPIISSPPPNGNAGNFRDDTTAWEANGVWNILVGSEVSGIGAVALYSTIDFMNWTYSGIFYTSDLYGNMWECPDFFPIGDSYVLKISALGKDWWLIGDYDIPSKKFVPKSNAQLWDSGVYYASKTFFDPVKKRQIIWGWIAEEDNGIPRGWQSVQGLPREISIDKDLNIVVANPIEEISLLRVNPGYSIQNVIVSPSKDFIPPIKGDQLEILAVFKLPAQGRFGVNVKVSNDSTRYTTIAVEPEQQFLNNTDLTGGDYNDFYYNSSTTEQENIELCRSTCDAQSECVSWTYVRLGDPGPMKTPRCSLKSVIPTSHPNNYCVSGVKGSVAVERQHSGTDGNTATQAGSIKMKSNEDTLTLHIFIDHSMIEVFAQQGRQRITR